MCICDLEEEKEKKLCKINEIYKKYKIIKNRIYDHNILIEPNISVCAFPNLH